MRRYEARRAVIIAGTSGMGLATAKLLLDRGARVLVTGRSQAGLESAQKELGNDAIVVSSDARSLRDINALATQVKTEFDTFDLLFANAGFSIPTPVGSVTEAIYDEMFSLNAKGPFFAVQKVAPLINRGGAVVLTTSSNGTTLHNDRRSHLCPDLVRASRQPCSDAKRRPSIKGWRLGIRVA